MSNLTNLTNVLQKFDNVDQLDNIGNLLSLPEEQFILLAPTIIESIEKNFSTTENKILFSQLLNISNIKLEDLTASFDELDALLNEETQGSLSKSKRNFLRQIISICYNTITESEGISKRIVNIPIERTSEEIKIPTYANNGDAALDLYSPDDYTINPGETKIIPVEIKTALPKGYAFLIHPRSGLSAKSKLRVANSIGIIDSGYRNIIGVIIENIAPKIEDIEYEFDDNGKIQIKSILHGKAEHITKGERFAQMRLVEVPTAHFFEVDSVIDIGENRGGGYGSSGKF